MHSHSHDIHPKNKRLHKIGVWVSFACSIHCLLTPIVLGILPFAGHAFIDNSFLEYALVGTSVMLGGYIFMNDYRKMHHNALPLVLLVLGFICFVVGHNLEGKILSTFISVSAGVMFFSAYLYNFRLHKKAHHCHVPEEDV